MESSRESGTAHALTPTLPQPHLSFPFLSLHAQRMTDISSYLLDSRVIFIGSRITDDVSEAE